MASGVVRGTDRRRETRRAVPRRWRDACLRLHAGDRLRLLNASSLGVLTEGSDRLQPGRHIHVHVRTHTGRLLVTGRVAWVRVSRVHPDELAYMAGIEFERAVDGVWCEHAVPQRPVSQG